MSLKPPSSPAPHHPHPPASRRHSHAVLRAGLVGGATLGIAIAGQRVAASPEMELLGWFIVIFGLFCVGYFAARDAGLVRTRREAARIGLVSGLIAGVVLGLSYVVVNLVLSLDAQQLQLVREASMENLQQWSPEQAQFYQNNPAVMDNMVRLSYGVFTGCCGLILPLLGLVLGAFGAMSASPTALPPEEPKP